jgi:hypothetical protein
MGRKLMMSEPIDMVGEVYFNSKDSFESFVMDLSPWLVEKDGRKVFNTDTHYVNIYENSWMVRFTPNCLEKYDNGELILDMLSEPIYDICDRLTFVDWKVRGISKCCGKIINGYSITGSGLSLDGL